MRHPCPWCLWADRPQQRETKALRARNTQKQKQLLTQKAEETGCRFCDRGMCQRSRPMCCLQVGGSCRDRPGEKFTGSICPQVKRSQASHVFCGLNFKSQDWLGAQEKKSVLAESRLSCLCFSFGDSGSSVGRLDVQCWHRLVLRHSTETLVADGPS